MTRHRPWSCRRDGHHWQLALLPGDPPVCHYCGTPENQPENPEPTRATPTAPPALAGVA